jgi:hypothetical protein
MKLSRTKGMASAFPRISHFVELRNLRPWNQPKKENQHGRKKAQKAQNL